MNDTPRTDAASGSGKYVKASTMRKMERELAKLNRRLDNSVSALAFGRLLANYEKCRISLADSNRVRDEWCAEYVKVRDALKAIVDFNTPLPAGLLEQAQAALK